LNAAKGSNVRYFTAQTWRQGFNRNKNAAIVTRWLQNAEAQ
jgi:hypothetical protein